MSELKSDYIVNYYNSWTEQKYIDNQFITFLYIQMELCEQNLKTFIELINELNEEKSEKLKYFIRSELLVEVIECINYLHSKNIFHRDLKPQNILIIVRKNKRIVKLCDFGLSKVYENKKLITNGENNRFIKLCDFGLSKFCEESQNTRGVGTLRYMAPEVIDRDGNPAETLSHYNLKSDVYSLGVIAKELFDLKDSIEDIRKMRSL